MEKDISCKWKEKKSWGSNTFIDKLDFKTKAIGSDKGYYIMKKGTIQKENINLVNIYYALNIGAPKYVKQILMNLKGEINCNTVIVGDFYHPIDINGYFFQTEMNKE